MNNTRILIIDNEEELRAGLRAMIIKIAGADISIEEADGVASGLEAIRQLEPDIVFLDIEMEDGTGFDLLQQLSTPKFQLIFTTAHNQYAIQAFRFSALDYLLKPINPDELRNSLGKAMENISRHDIAAQLAVMMQQLHQKTDHDRKLVLNDKQSTYFVRIADILFCEAEGPYTRFFISGGDPILVSRNLKEFEEMLTPLGFLRTHHSYVVNPARIRMYDKTDGGALILDSGHNVPLSQRRKDIVIQSLEKDNSKPAKK